MRAGWVLAIGLLSIACSKQRYQPGPGDDLTAPERSVEIQTPEREVTAAGGVPVVVVTDIASRLIEVGVRVRTGHIDDPPGKEGLAHLVEHLIFELRPGGASQPIAALRAWHQQHHRPEGALLVITGHFSPQLVRRHIEVAFADWKGGQASTLPPATPVGRRALAVIDDRATHLSIELEVPLALARPADEAAARVAAELLDERLSTVRERLGAAYYLDAVVEARMLTPSLTVAGQIDVRFVPEVMALAAGAIADLRAGKIDADTLERARRRATRAARARLAVADGISERLVQAHLLGREPGEALAVVEAIARTTAAEVSAAASAEEHIELHGPRGAVNAGFKALGVTPEDTID